MEETVIKSRILRVTKVTHELLLIAISIVSIIFLLPVGIVITAIAIVYAHKRGMIMAKWVMALVLLYMVVAAVLGYSVSGDSDSGSGSSISGPGDQSQAKSDR